MITKALEDYLEFILVSVNKNIELKAIDIANNFNISRASVSEALIRLSDLDLIIYEGRKGIKLTQKGKTQASKIIKKHKILADFLINILGIDEELSSVNACKIEHVIDEEVINKLEKFIKFSKINNINKYFKEYSLD